MHADNLTEMLRRLSLAVSLLLVFASCTASGDPTTTSNTGATTTSTLGDTATTGGEATTTTSETAPSITEPDLSGLEGVSDQVRAQLGELIRIAQEIRDLAFLSPPTITVVSEDEFEARIRDQISEDSEDIPADEALYKMLGLLSDTADLETILGDLYGEQAAGYYDGETAEIVVPAREDGFSVLQQGTLVHELVHAVTDQHFDQFDDWVQMIDEDRLDEAAAYQALFEGDAMMAEVLWVQTLTQTEIGEFIAESLEVDTEALDAAPRFLAESLVFPYDTGLAFVQDLYLSGGWEDVNDAYSAFLPLPPSTEQVITPDDYQRDLPVSVDIPDVTVDGYELVRTSVWGEQSFRLLLNQGEGVDTVATAADGWGGDSYRQWFDGQNAALLIVYQGDTRSDVDELEQALAGYANDSYPEDHFAWVEQLDGDLYFIAADDTEVGERLRAAVGLDQ